MWNVNSKRIEKGRFASRFYLNYVECKSGRITDTPTRWLSFYLNYVECKFRVAWTDRR